jgi:hypothetical protein
LARFYCDRNTRAAFSWLFSELFRIVPEITRIFLKFFAFFLDDSKALLHAIILDAEASQAQGLQDEIVIYVALHAAEWAKSHPTSPMELLLIILKTCCVHFEW